MNIKPILSIETSGNLCGASVYFDETKYFETIINLKNSHSEKIFDVIDKTLSYSGTELKDLDCIAVSAGPGSFTGLRIGLSAVKGLAYGASLPVCPVPTFEALALQLSHVFDEGTEFVIANKVNLEEAYFARFYIKSNSYIFAENLQLVSLSELPGRTKGTRIFGNALVKKNEFSAPRPLFVAEWCRYHGAELKTFDFDLLEPNYIKNFVVKEVKQ
jgi:tRNA threonylcarbamoyladenosine biosynthesis protein TsaB